MVEKFNEAAKKEMAFSVRQKIDFDSLHPIRALRCIDSHWIDLCPHDTQSFLELERLHNCIKRGLFYDPDVYDCGAMFAMPRQIYDWYRLHTFDELVNMWIETAARYIVRCDWIENREKIIAKQTPATILDDVFDRARLLRAKEAPRIRLPAWLNFQKHFGDYSWFIKGFSVKCMAWGWKPDDILSAKSGEIDSLTDRHEADVDAYKFCKAHQKGECWPAVRITLRKDQIGFVYLLFDGEYFKIGYSENDPESRLKSCQTGSSRKLSLVGFIRGTREKEQILHSFFAGKRVHGEWFDLTKGDVSKILGRRYE